MGLRQLILAFLFLVGADVLPAAERAVVLDAKTGTVSARIVPQLNIEAQAAQAIDLRIAGKTANDASKKLFSTLDHTTPAYVRSATCWAADLDTTAISVWNSTFGGVIGATAITPRHVVHPHHAPLADGATIRFVTRDSVLVTRVMSSTVRLGDSDIEVGTLDADLPSTITPVGLLPSNYVDVLTLTGLPALASDQEKKAIVQQIGGVGSAGIFFGQAPATPRSTWWEEPVGGDSGSPSCLVLDGRLYLLSTYTTGGGGSGPNYAANLAALQTLVGSYPLAVYAPGARQQVRLAEVVGAGNAAGKTAAVAATAGQIPLVDTDGKISASLIVTGALTWSGVTGKPFTAASTGGNGPSDSGKAALFSTVGGMNLGSPAQNSDYLLNVQSGGTTGGVVAYIGKAGGGAVSLRVEGGTSSAAALAAVQLDSGATSDIAYFASSSTGGSLYPLALRVLNNGALDWGAAQAKTDTRANLGLGSVATQSASSVAITGGTAQLSGLTLASDILLTDSGGSRDIRLTGNTGFIRFMAAASISGAPAGASMQFFGNASGLPGQVYIDSGADDNAAIIFRTSGTGGAATERMRIAANGQVTISSLLHLTPRATPSSPTEGDVYANSSDHHFYFYNGSAWKQLDN